ncbi:DUF4097 family beta strand repeat-containing protein [Paenibacillus sp. HW567]|uniref:DUF4097 family beta strand repeat-containing protein n=1 Tax=Paenibacillus sp. HW567 TaxID=1034769 RepID=UPI00035F1E1F|nr:DUF4097 family beta strand repeat-containing protein [Paenibacillus sp. HW567]
MKNAWKLLLAGAAVAAAVFYIGLGAAESRQVVDSAFESSTAAPASKPQSSAAAVMTSSQAVLQTSAGGYSCDKGITRVNVPSSTQSVSIANTNGTIDIKEGKVKDIEIHMTVDVDQASKEEAKRVADKAGIQVSKGAKLEIKTYSEPYGNMHYPSINLTVTLPQRMTADLEVKEENGNLTLSNLSNTGKIKLSTVNGDIGASGIGSDISLHLVNGNVDVSDAAASVTVSLTNGDVEADQIAGPLKMKITNGNLTARNAFSAIEAAATNGSIDIASGRVGGNWKVSTMFGDMELAWPGSSDVQVDAKSAFGEIETDFPLTVKNHRATGQIGKGTYRIDVQSMSELSLLKMN